MKLGEVDNGSADNLLEELFAAAEAARFPAMDAFLQSHPNQPEAAAHAWRTAEAYQRQMESYWAEVGLRPRTLPRGACLGEFEILSVIGRGGMGTVYRARQKSLGDRIVAVKVMRKGVLHGKATEDFRREAMTLAQTHHPNLAEVFGFGEQDGSAYFAMRLVEGPTLRDVLRELARHRQKALQCNEVRLAVARIMEVALPLAMLHASGLIHGDVKPRNIILEGSLGAQSAALDQRAVLVDFGLVRTAAASSRSARGAATPSYASPEQLMGNKLDARTDVFSLGATLHDLIARRLPDERLPASAGLNPIDVLVPELDRDLAAIIGKAVDPVAEWRYPDARELYADLECWMDGRETTARRWSVPERGVRRLKRHPRRVLGVVAVATAGTLLVWAAAVCGDAAMRIERARHAWKSAELVEAWTELEKVPDACLRIWPGVTELVAIKDALGDEVATSHLADELECLHREQWLLGALAAAADVRRDGPEAHPVQRRWLEYLFRRYMKDNSFRSRVPSLGIALARLFIERPVNSDAERGAWNALAGDLRRCVWSNNLPRDEALCLIAVLSGLGTHTDVPHLLQWIHQQPLGSEEKRLGYQCLATLLRRATVCGHADQIMFDDIWLTLAPDVTVVDELRRIRPLHAGDPRYASVDEAAAAALFAERTLAGQPDLQKRLPHLSVDRVASAAEFIQHYARYLLCATGTPGLSEWLCSGELYGGSSGGPMEWGQCIGAFGDEMTTSRARARCHELASVGGHQDAMNGFECGIRLGAADRSGNDPGAEPDQDSLLGAGHEQVPHDLPVYRGVGTTMNDPDGFLLARWSLEGSGVALAGSACAVRGNGINIVQEGPGNSAFCRLGEIGRSTLRLQFKSHDAPDEGARLTLCLTHAAAARALFPFEGSVVLNICVNGAVVVEGWPVMDAARSAQQLELPRERFRPGSNEITLTLQPQSTTTYRIWEAAVVDLSPSRRAR